MRTIFYWNQACVADRNRMGRGVEFMARDMASVGVGRGALELRQTVREHRQVSCRS